MNKNNYKRQFVSFTGKCPYKCNHCYTFCSGYDSYDSGTTVAEIIDSLKNESFNIVYVSGHKENFLDADIGLDLCEEIFQNYQSDILVTTRNIFNIHQLHRLEKLNKNMKSLDCQLYFCASIPALQSYKKLEPNALIPSPKKRIENLINVFNAGIHTFLTLRPLCPDSYISIDEAVEIIEMCKDNVSIVLSSGIVVNHEILAKLKDFPPNFIGEELPLMPCLKNDIPMNYVDVKKELDIIKKECSKYGIPFFEHSLPAIEYLKKHIY